MKEPEFAELIAEIARRSAPATAVATSLMVTVARAVSGDLDRSYGDVGRLGSIAELARPAWSIELLDDGCAVLGGGSIQRL